jgi:hypothetical protein
VDPVAALQERPASQVERTADRRGQQDQPIHHNMLGAEFSAKPAGA